MEVMTLLLNIGPCKFGSCGAIFVFVCVCVCVCVCVAAQLCFGWQLCVRRSLPVVFSGGRKDLGRVTGACPQCWSDNGPFTPLTPFCESLKAVEMAANVFKWHGFSFQNRFFSDIRGSFFSHPGVTSTSRTFEETEQTPLLTFLRWRLLCGFLCSSLGFVAPCGRWSGCCWCWWWFIDLHIHPTLFRDCKSNIIQSQPLTQSEIALQAGALERERKKRPKYSERTHVAAFIHKRFRSEFAPNIGVFIPVFDGTGLP